MTLLWSRKNGEATISSSSERQHNTVIESKSSLDNVSMTGAKYTLDILQRRRLPSPGIDNSATSTTANRASPMNAMLCSNCNNTSSSSSSPALVGWVLESGGRGTLNLLTTCLVTIFLCTWVVIHPRVDKRESYATMHKFALFFKTLLAPEFIAVEGLQEWAQCRRTEGDCASLTGEGFKLIHAFYVSMLALRYRTPLGDRVIWPNQYTWLLEQGLINWRDHASWGLSRENIRDKSKADSIARLVTLLQVSWFVAQSIMRTAHGLPLSQLESLTLSYIPLFGITYFFWWHKPKDILMPSIVNLPRMNAEQMSVSESMAVSNKFDDEGLRDQVTYWNVWFLTPRVFEKEADDRALLKAREQAAKRKAAARAVSCAQPNSNTGTSLENSLSGDDKDDLENLKIDLAKEKVVAHWDPHLYRSNIWPVTCLFGISFGALHLIAWDTVFPTVVELWLWRVSAFVSIGSMLIFMQFQKVVFRWGGPLTLISLLTPGLYFLSRIVMMAEVFAALRAEDPAIYDTYEVSTYWTHL